MQATLLFAYVYSCAYDSVYTRLLTILSFAVTGSYLSVTMAWDYSVARVKLLTGFSPS